jgi:hypothetical protein
MADLAMQVSRSSSIAQRRQLSDHRAYEHQGI